MSTEFFDGDNRLQDDDLKGKIRSSNQNSVDHELRFVSKIGVYQMEQDIQQRVKYLTRKVAEKM